MSQTFLMRIIDNLLIKYFNCRKLPKPIWSVSLRTPTCAPSTPNVWPSCLRISNWLVVFVVNVLKTYGWNKNYISSFDLRISSNFINVPFLRHLNFFMYWWKRTHFFPQNSLECIQFLKISQLWLPRYNSQFSFLSKVQSVQNSWNTRSLYIHTDRPR